MGVVEFAAGDLRSVAMDVVDAHDALTDTPIPSFYRELDAKYPGSKFILTVREKEGWLKSCMKQFNQRFTDLQNDAVRRLFADLYGTDVFERELFGSGYERFVAGVLNYFQHRPGDLLIMDVAAGDGWEKLCPFLGRDVPDLPFPKANVTQVRWMSIDDVVAVAQQAGRELMQRYEVEHSGNPSDGGNAGGHSGGAKRLLQRTLRTVLGKEGGQSAAEAANKLIVAGLKRLVPQIPVLSRLDEVVPFAERKRWNHVWLVDPLDGEAPFVSGSGEFSVNIALIEDGRPIYGVVHLLPEETTYYARLGKAGYKQVRGRDATRLATESAPDRARGEVTEQGVATLMGGTASAYAPTMCALIERMDASECALVSSSEWQTAAAHAVLSCAGMRVCAGESGEDLVYNKSNLSDNGPVIVRQAC